MKRNTDLYSGLFMIFISLLFWSKLSKLNEYSKLFPIIVIIVLSILGLVLIIKSFVKASRSELFVVDDKKSVILIVLVTLAWIFLFKKIGFAVTSFVALTALLCILSDKRNIKAYFKCAIISAVEIVILYMIFSNILYVPFPKGLLF